MQPFVRVGWHSKAQLENHSVDNLGGKGYHLLRMSKVLKDVGGKIPPAFVIPVGRGKQATAEALQKELQVLVDLGTSPVSLFSVRSGAPVSMPGMMETILNVGAVEKYPNLVTTYGIPTANKILLRFIEMYSTIVCGVNPLAVVKLKGRIDSYYESEDFFDLLEAWASDELPKTKHNPFAELSLAKTVEACAKAVFESWDTDRAKHYRKINNIPSDMGTACVVQKMVFGNLNEKSGTGVLFTRNPNTGESGVFGEFLINAQGEDVVAGLVTPMPLSDMEKCTDEHGNFWADMYKEICTIATCCESLSKDMQDMEFTVEDGVLFFLQTRNGKRTPKAAVEIAASLYKEGIITKEEALSKITPKLVSQLNNYELVGEIPEPTYQGIGASSGVVKGVVVHNLEEAKSVENPVFLAKETTPEDIELMSECVGFVTATGGGTSHAAVVARAMNKEAVVGVFGLDIDIPYNTTVVLDGKTGYVWFNMDLQVTKSLPESINQFLELVYESNAGQITLESPFKGKAVLYECEHGVAKRINEDLESGKSELAFLSLYANGIESFNYKPLLENLGLSFTISVSQEIVLAELGGLKYKDKVMVICPATEGELGLKKVSFPKNLAEVLELDGFITCKELVDSVGSAAVLDIVLQKLGKKAYKFPLPVEQLFLGGV